MQTEETKSTVSIVFIALLVISAAVAMRVSQSYPNTDVKDGRVAAVESNNLAEPDAEFFQDDSYGKPVTLPVKIPPETKTSAPANPLPAVTAKAYLIGNVDTGEIYFERNSSAQMPVASMSKLVTAIVATDTMPPTTTIEITPDHVLAPPDGSGIGAGERFILSELMYPMLLDSSNIAAEAIAAAGDRAGFLEDMSGYAWEIGMPEAYFADPSGVDPHNMASARNIFALARYLYGSQPDILSLTRTAAFSIGTTSDHGAHGFRNIHPFVSDPRFIGGKTGRTPEAGETMLTIMKMGGKPVAFVVMGSRVGARENDTRLLMGVVDRGVARN